jgi:1-acyl-sn-glycerol-3-phosphate acyltransferase
MTIDKHTEAQGAPIEKSEREGELFALVSELVRELHARSGTAATVNASSRLDRDLGIDSLGRTELILRIEHAFGVRLPANTLADADTVGDLLIALGQSAPRVRRTRSVVQGSATASLVESPDEARTLIEALEWHVARHPDRIHVTLLEDEATVLGTMTYRQLADSARSLATGLVAQDVVPGDRVALMLPTSLEFFTAFFGILYAGATPVPIYPPARLSQLEEHMLRQAGILNNAGVRILITVPQALRLGTLLRGQVSSLNQVASVSDLIARSGSCELPATTDPDATAFIQYTSGSTGNPKGVVLSHANLLANIRALGVATDASSKDVFVSWLPLYHDLGLIGGWLGSLYFAASFYVMSPLSFLRRPETWLWAIHRYRATLSAAPNFAFELCLGKIEDADIQGLDLASLRIVANGAEPVSAQTIRRFAKRFQQYKFRPETMSPGYGLAENTVVLTFPPLGRGPLIDRVNRDALSRRGTAQPAQDNDAGAVEIVSCGRPLPGHEVRIVDETGRECEERQEGRLEFRGPSATSGYFRDEAKTQELLHGGWLDSGDQAYMAGGEVFVTGRIKDIIIRAGRHIYPHEIEEAVGEIPGILKTGVAVFGISDPASGTERTVILAETMELDPALRSMLQAKAREAATGILGAPPDEVVLAPPQTVPKTSSGKIRRSAARELYESGEIGRPARSIRWQLVRLFIAGIGPRIARLAGSALRVLYAGWWWLVVALAGAFIWLAVMVLPRLTWRWAAVRAIARAALFILGARFSVTGRDRVPSRNVVIVFNHASYADALAVAAALPGAPAFAAKKELASQMVAGPFLRRLGAQFLDRYDVATSLADTEAVIGVAREGRPIVFFPEGTFTRRTGLSAFYLGAFKVAAAAGLPVIPGTIVGTRSMLRGEQWFPRWASISVHLGEPVAPTGTDFASVLQLRDKVRSIIVSKCGEPDLGGLSKPAAPSADA